MPRRAPFCFLILCLAGAARAADTVVSGGLAEQCYQAADAGRFDFGAEALCSGALITEALDDDRRAAVLTNRGVMRLRRADYEAARADFDAATVLAPASGEAFVDRGAALLGQGRYSEAIADLDKGLALGAKEPEKAIFDRALAHEALGDPKSAYSDYLRASALRPGWSRPEGELRRFTIVPR